MKLTVEKAGFEYKKGIPVLENIDFCVESGEILAILGPNGAGKTTLLRCMMGFLKWSCGRSKLNGEDISKMSSRKLWQSIAYVPQAKSSFSAMTAREMILLGMTNRIGVFSSPSEADMRDAKEIADKLRIGHLLDKKCTQISGGELQMVLIARALAAKPEILILDEPESNLDFKNQLIVLDTMSRLAAEGMCIVFNTHYPSHALTRATKSLLIGKAGVSQGVSCIFGDTVSVVTKENIRRTFGVEAVIGEVETAHNTYKSVMPLRVSDDDEKNDTAVSDKKMIAVISVIFSDYNYGERINEILSEHRDDLVGRMGMPYREGGVYIINATLDATKNAVESLTHKIGLLPDVSVKATFAREVE